jgi:hypothetical protein
MATLEEIIVTGRRRRGASPSPDGDPLENFRNLDRADEMDREEDGREEEIEEITVTAVATKLAKDQKEALRSATLTPFEREMAEETARREAAKRMGKTPLERTLGEKRAADLKRALDAARKAEIDEIIVTGKRFVSGAARIGMRGGFGVVDFVDIGARIADQISRQRLDDAGRIATRTVPPKPDTPVKTIPAEVIPEIIVRAKRPKPKRPKFPEFSRDFPDTSLPFVVEFPNQNPTAAPEISVPTPKPPKKRKPKIVDLMLTDSPGRQFLTNPLNLPRSRLLRIPQRTTRPDNPPGNLTGVGPQVLTSPFLAGGNGCAPCKKPKPKDRKKCFKTLVKQATNPKNDKVFKLVEINCKTGKEIPKKKDK